MLYPKTNATRSVIDLSGLWSFTLSDIPYSEQPDFPGKLEKADRLAVPASYNDQKEDPAFRRHCGWAFYQRECVIPQVFSDQRLVLRFDAVTHEALVFLNDRQICHHKGGFLPFETEITDLVRRGESILLTVAVNNRIDNSTLPIGNESSIAFFGSDNSGIPSVESAKAWRQATNLPNFDFFNYAGINRPVRIYTTPKAHITDVTLVPEISGTDGIIHYDVKTDGDGSVSVSVCDADGKNVATAVGASGTLSIPNARLWEPWPGTPYLYTVNVDFASDSYALTCGIRSVEVQGKSFLINGNPFYFKGFGKHEDSAIHGRGFDLCLDVKDISLIHWLHANSFRTSHYPYAEEMMDLCDREGIVVIDETPAVGIGAGVQQDPYKTFPIKKTHEQVLSDLIERDKNHACIVMWSLGNEPDTEHFPKSAYDYWRPLYEQAHRLDPQGRPVTLVCCQNDYTKDIITRTMDVVCLNRYYGWYNLSGDLDAACYALNQELDFWESQNKPVMFTEYGADAIAGIHMTVPEMFSEEFQVDFYDRINSELDRRDFIVGEQVWCFADFGTIQGCMRADGNKKGLFTRDRRPKMAAHYFRKRWKNK